ncbi:MAG: YjbQ family protein [Deltaproteobacteria bacterium]|nr:YjbQ family protein [Deltaproteobacteria bacterium]
MPVETRELRFSTTARTDLIDITPETIPCAHDARWGNGNGYGHVRAALIGPSLHVPVIDGMLALGSWQQIVLPDFDNRPRERRVLAQFHGD